MPALGSPIVRKARRLANAYRLFPGPPTTSPSEVLAWYEANDPGSETNVRLAIEREDTHSINGASSSGEAQFSGRGRSADHC